MVVICVKQKIKTILKGLALSVLFVGLCFSQKTQTILTSAKLFSYVIVIDAGHGVPDGGAVSKSGVEEEALNLIIAQKLKEELEKRGYDIIMTRETHENIADEDKKKTLKETKQSDLENRVKIANQSGADFMISIHMNEFSKNHYWGWQTFYSKHSEEGKRLAKSIQTHITNIIDRPNKRGVLPIENIKIVDHTTIPVVIVECGFLSNEEDAKLLQTEVYQNQLVEGIANGVEQYYAHI